MGQSHLSGRRCCSLEVPFLLFIHGASRIWSLYKRTLQSLRLTSGRCLNKVWGFGLAAITAFPVRFKRQGSWIPWFQKLSRRSSTYNLDWRRDTFAFCCAVKLNELFTSPPNLLHLHQSDYGSQCLPTNSVSFFNLAQLSQ